MRGEGGGRPPWAHLPEGLREAVGRVLGGPVVAARSQAGGFSPGSADRVRTAAGERAFVKAVDAVRHPGSADLHRREAGVLALLPSGLSVPRLLAVVEEAGWLALVTEDVDGRTPELPWRRDELDAALAAFDVLTGHVPAGELEAQLPPARDDLTEELDGFARLSDDPPGDLDPWVAERVDELAALGRRGTEALEGDRLLHTDVRADNLLVLRRGGVAVVDWPYAVRGAPFFDVLGLLLNVRLWDPALDADGLLDGHCPGAGDAATAVLAGMAGMFIDNARKPAPEGLPRLRVFQAAQGAAAVVWLRERW